MQTAFKVVVLVSVLGIASVGCGGGDGTTPISTSVPGDKQLGGLTPGERDQLCADLGAWAMSGSFLNDACNTSAWLATFLQSSTDNTTTDANLRILCEGLHAQCVANGVMSMCEQPSTACTATVSEYTTCLMDGAEALSGLPPCSSVTRASLAAEIAGLGAQPTSAACTAVETKCPELAAD
jgi:hypothetical protein